jgi:hypothetical protein
MSRETMFPAFAAAIVLAALTASAGPTLAADTTRYKPQTVKPAPPSTYKPKLERPGAAAVYKPQLARPGEPPKHPPAYRVGGPVYSAPR